MRLADYIDPQLVLVDCCTENKLRIFDPLVEAICRVHPELDHKALLESLQEREKKYSTGLESGIAVPHALMPGLQKPICLVARLAEPVEFGTLDGSPVRILFLLVSPQEAIASHIRILARIARLCSISTFLERMLQAADAGELFQAIREEDGRHV